MIIISPHSRFDPYSGGACVHQKIYIFFLLLWFLFMVTVDAIHETCGHNGKYVFTDEAGHHKNKAKNLNAL